MFVPFKFYLVAFLDVGNVANSSVEKGLPKIARADNLHMKGNVMVLNFPRSLHTPPSKTYAHNPFPCPENVSCFEFRVFSYFSTFLSFFVVCLVITIFHLLIWNFYSDIYRVFVLWLQLHFWHASYVIFLHIFGFKQISYRIRYRPNFLLRWICLKSIILKFSIFYLILQYFLIFETQVSSLLSILLLS